MKRLLAFLLIIIMFAMVLVSCSANGNQGSIANSEKPQETEGRTPVKPKYYSYAEIVSYLYNMERLAQVPLTGEASKECTSYDRASVYNEETDTYEGWSANADGTGIIREQEDGGKVIAEMEGPGYITRIWSAQTDGYGKGHIKIYIDGNETPVIDDSFQKLFRGNKRIFPYDSLSYMSAARGYNCYVPITYNKSCKVVVYDDWGLYYHVNYTQLPENATVESMTYPLSAENKAALEAADAYLSGDLSLISVEDGQTQTSQTYSIKKGQQTDVFQAEGAGAITALQIQVEGLTGEFQDWVTLKDMTISMYWDKETIPSVWTPLEDFFGTTGGVNPYVSLPMGVTEDGVFYSRWYMPYADGAKICIGNDGQQDYTVKVTIITEDVKDIEKQMRFHAKWQRMTEADDNDQRWPDSQVLSVKGTGRFLGMMLHNYKTSGETDPDSRDGFAWWGEGDEKFFIDGEKFPSWFGTGTEDYFGYAWCDPTLYDEAFHAQTFNKGGINGEGNKVVSRYQVIDNIPFFKSFDGYLEKYYGDNYNKYANVTWFYLTANTEDGVGSFDLETRTNYYQYLPPEATFVEGEAVYVKGYSNGTVDVQGMESFGTDWSGNAQLWWKPMKKGATMELYVNMPEAGTYMVKTNLTMAGDYGIVQFSCGENKIGEAFDGYNNGVKASGEIVLGTVTLEKGINVITLTVTGRNEKASSYMVGLDYLKFEK